MIEVSPILSGKFDAADYVPAQSNINRPAPNGVQPLTLDAGHPTIETDEATNNTESAASAGVDARRYTKFDRTASSNVPSIELSFSDILDAINPLQHIPLASSLYRGLEGESINPVSRITGDILYGSIFGIGSAIVGSLAGVGDSVMISQTGQSMAGGALEALLDDKETVPQDNKTQLASGDTSIPDVKSPSLSLAEAPQEKPENLDPKVQVAAIPEIPRSPTPQTEVNTLAKLNQKGDAEVPPQTQGFLLDRSKLPYGGVMDLASNPTLAMALTEGSHGTQIGHSIYLNRVNAAHNNVAKTSSVNSSVTKNSLQPINQDIQRPDISLSNTSSSSSVFSDALSKTLNVGQNSISQDLIKDLLSLREFKQFPATANAGKNTNSVNITN